MLYLMQRARSSAKFTLLRNTNANPVREKISSVTLLSRESLSSSLALFCSLSFLYFLLHCRCGEGTPPQKVKKKHTRGKSVKKIKAWLTHTVGFCININPFFPSTPTKIMWLRLVNGVYCFLPKDSRSSIQPLIHLLIFLARFLGANTFLPLFSGCKVPGRGAPLQVRGPGRAHAEWTRASKQMKQCRLKREAALAEGKFKEGVRGAQSQLCYAEHVLFLSGFHCRVLSGLTWPMLQSQLAQ